MVMTRRRPVVLVAAAVLVWVTAGCDLLSGRGQQENQTYQRSMAASVRLPATGIVTEDNEGSIDLNWFDQQLKNGLPANITLVDVRTAEEFNQGHATGALNIPVAFMYSDDGCGKVTELLPKDGFVVFYCGYGPRSKDMYYNLKDPVSEGGCSYGDMDRLYYLNSTVYIRNGMLELPH